jgi:hypothetical protein
MNSTRIEFILKHDPVTRKIFRGFAHPDYLKPFKKYPCLLILNTDSITGPGEHWCACYFLNKNYAEFFDPYGLSPDIYGFTPLIKKYSKKIHFNKTPVQGLLASTCGHHVLFYALHRTRGLSSRTILNKFYTNDPVKNDNMVFKYLQKFGRVFGEIEQET